MRIGLVSDTHGYFDPELRSALAGVELILHAGDVGRADVLEELGGIAPVRAVCGNVDTPSPRLPLTLTLKAGGVKIHVLHIFPGSPTELAEWAESEREGCALPPHARRLIRSFEPGVEIVLFGHSHSPLLELMGGILWVNPGSAGRKRFSLPRTCARLEASADSLKVEIVNLEPQVPGDLPKAVEIKRVRAKEG